MSADNKEGTESYLLSANSTLSPHSIGIRVSLPRKANDAFRKFYLKWKYDFLLSYALIIPHVSVLTLAGVAPNIAIHRRLWLSPMEESRVVGVQSQKMAASRLDESGGEMPLSTTYTSK